MNTEQDRSGVREAYLAQTQLRLTEVREKLARLGSQADSIGRCKTRLEVQLATVERRLARLCSDDADSWERNRRSLDAAWDDLGQAINAFISRFR